MAEVAGSSPASSTEVLGVCDARLTPASRRRGRSGPVALLIVALHSPEVASDREQGRVRTIDQFGGGTDVNLASVIPKLDQVPDPALGLVRRRWLFAELHRDAEQQSRLKSLRERGAPGDPADESAAVDAHLGVHGTPAVA